jgi:hypothetical protein
MWKIRVLKTPKAFNRPIQYRAETVTQFQTLFWNRSVQPFSKIQRIDFLYGMGLQSFYGNGRRPVLWAGARVARGNITIRATPNCLTYWKSLCYIHSLLNGHVLHAARGPPVEDPCLMVTPCIYTYTRSQTLMRCHCLLQQFVEINRNVL